MIRNQRVLGLIVARGGSKGVPRKNIRLVNGKPLICWSIEEARKSQFIDRLILSSEDPEIIDVALKSGSDVPFIRPANLAEDQTSTFEVVEHALKEMNNFDLVVLLQPTSPLRLVSDIDTCISKCSSANIDACVSVVQSRSHPAWMFSVSPEGHLSPFLKQTKIPERRQDLIPAYELNGAVYVAKIPWYLEQKTFIGPTTAGYEMPLERSIDLDTEEDFRILESLLARR